MHEESIFLTLTYDDENLPLGNTLVRKHLTDFFKRLRKKTPPLRTFYCGEYGGKTERPHYHALIFGYRPGDAKTWKETSHGRLFTSANLEKTWGLGHAPFGDVTYQSAGYVARYNTKLITGDCQEEHYRSIDPETGEITDREPEFGGQSRRPGIGIPYLIEHRSEIYRHGHIIMNGKPVPIPPAYDRYMKKHFPAEWQKILASRLHHITASENEYRANQRSENPDLYTGSWLHSKAVDKITRQRLQLKDQI